jgi:transposase
LTDDEWAFFEPFVTESGPLRGRPPRDHRRTRDAIFWIARTGAPWRDLPEELGNWNSVHRQFRRWTASGLGDLMLTALAEGGGGDTLQMIDSTIVRAHHYAVCGEGGLRTRLWAGVDLKELRLLLGEVSVIDTLLRRSLRKKSSAIWGTWACAGADVGCCDCDVRAGAETIAITLNKSVRPKSGEIRDWSTGRIRTTPVSELRVVEGEGRRPQVRQCPRRAPERHAVSFRPSSERAP